MATIIQADVYDTYEFVAEVYGGIGAGRYVDDNEDPLCAAGIRFFLAGKGDFGFGLPFDLNRYGISPLFNDRAVRVINERKGKEKHARVSWSEYCEELGIVRGE